ncbi:hypothetical protein [Variovorax sp. PCZ-1]|uniref:hypothetical protein n=1 Tax=Variovorax sp. PCZ-1 TaxID=2835533 RepID=UPI001BCA84B9|nr:hypothetical protein [Variovorax sp. PCZ-1]MBS7807612.1 hypothetical protein [Variovorax sp. PCZ-1]
MSQASLLIEVPCLLITLKGFDTKQVACIEEWLSEFYVRHDATSIRWQITKHSSADVVLSALPDSSLELNSSELSPIKLNFWACNDDRLQETMESSKLRFWELLAGLDEQVQSQCARYVVAGMMVDRYLAKLPLKGMWHLMCDGEMLAAVDFVNLKVAVREQTHFLEFDECIWVNRPSSAKLPQSFDIYPIEFVMWEYARRSERQLLPSRFFEQRISLRRFPRLPLAFMNDLDIALLASLRQSPQTLTQISQRLGLPSEQTARLMSAMYFSGAITTRRIGFWDRLVQRLRPSRKEAFPSSQTTVPWVDADYTGPASLLLGQSKKVGRRDH